MSERRYPELPTFGPSPTRPISFVGVRFCGEYDFNLVRSQAVRDPINELITIDNTGNLAFDNLTEAMQAGMARARHELIAVVHEDVLLPDGWQARFEACLNELEESDPDWGLLGSVGWNADEEILGHWSDPGLYMDTLGASAYRLVERLDEQLLIFHRARQLPLDPNLPSVHHIGRDLCRVARALGLNAYAVNAPTVHKYADAEGHLIVTPVESPKVVERSSRRFHADYTFSTEYIRRKWPDIEVINQHYFPNPIFGEPFPEPLARQLSQPILLLARGGGGSRLLSRLCRDLGIFLGSELNESGDSLEMAVPIFHAILEKYRGRASWQRENVVPRLRSAAARMLLEARLPPEQVWGFKLPESLLLLPELAEAFPSARFLHLVRDPVATCLRRTHLTARLDNCIGRISLPEAYAHLGLARTEILRHTPAEHMAYTTSHQLDLVRQLAAQTPAGRFVELRFEDLVAAPTSCLERVRTRLGLDRVETLLESSIDPDRARPGAMSFPPAVEAQVREILHPVRVAFGYAPE